MDYPLSDVQQRIVDHRLGHLRIVACPGSGKTETVSQRIAQMIAENENPSEIVAFTFTRKAAENLRHRIRKHLEERSDRTDFGDMYVGTIDAFCLHLIKTLRPEYKSFEILDESKKIAFIERWYWLIGLNEIRQRDGIGKWRLIKKFSDSLDRIINERINVNQITDAEFVTCYNNYVQRLSSERFFDYGSVITTLIDIIQNDETVAEDLHTKIKHVVFDEYQDVNLLQETLLELLSVGSKSVCVVGDDDQNIFQWRGSNVQHILEFPEKYDHYGVTTEELGINYRSTDALIASSRSFIELNHNRVAKNIAPFPQQHRRFQQGDLVSREFPTDTEEFQYIHDEIQRLLGSDFINKHGETFALSPKDFAILVRTNNDASRIAGFLREHGINVIAESGGGVFATPEVELAMDCIFFAFGSESYASQNIPEIDGLVQRFVSIFGNTNEENFRHGVSQIRGRAETVFAKGQNDYLPNLGLQEFFHRVLSAMGAELQAFNNEQMYHLGVLSKTISDYEYVYQSLRARQVGGLKWYIRESAQNMVEDPSQQDPTMLDSVRVMTIFKAKGLEFPVVFLPSFTTSSNPRRWPLFVDDSIYDAERYHGNEEDNRRVYYTAITRSQKYLYITSSAIREINAPRQHTNTRPMHQHEFIEQITAENFSDIANLELLHSNLNPAPAENGIFPTSYTKMAIYDRCPYDYRFRNVMGFNAGVPSAFGYGTNIHNILNKIHSDYISKKIVPSEKDVEELFEKMFFLRFAPGPQNETYKSAGVRVVKNYVHDHQNDFERLLDTEKRFEFVHGDSIISGDIDLLKKVGSDGKVTNVEIIDFKTDRQNEDGEYDVDYSNQVRFYAYAARESLGYSPKKALIHHLDNDSKDEIDISPEEQEKTMGMIAQRVGQILNGNFEPKPEENRCKGCDFRAICSHKNFEVGVDFAPTKSTKKSGRSLTQKIQNDPEEEPGSTAPVVSKDMLKRAEKLVEKNLVSQNEDGTFDVGSSTDTDKTYHVVDMRCTCRGFTDYFRRNPGTNPTCSHVEAIKIMESNS